MAQIPHALSSTASALAATVPYPGPWFGERPDPMPEGWRDDVSHAYVHRSDPADVFVDAWTRVSETSFTLATRWPAGHRFFAPVSGFNNAEFNTAAINTAGLDTAGLDTAQFNNAEFNKAEFNPVEFNTTGSAGAPPSLHQDPLLIAETMRQTAMLVAHAEFSVPLDDRFVMWHLGYTASRDGLELREPGCMKVDLSCSQLRRRGRGLAGMHVSFRFRRRDEVVATGIGIISCTSAAAYRRLRGDRPRPIGRGALPLPPGLPPAVVGRASPNDVVLAPSGRPGVWLLRLDTGHPTLFSRPNDHVPGIVLLEACRQAANAAAPRRPFLPAEVRIDFHRYAELDRPCWIEVHPPRPEEDGPGAPGAHRIRVEGVQDGLPVFTAVLESPPPPDNAA